VKTGSDEIGRDQLAINGWQATLWKGQLLAPSPAAFMTDL
jgi:hypothetical protein